MQPIIIPDWKRENGILRVIPVIPVKSTTNLDKYQSPTGNPQFPKTKPPKLGDFGIRLISRIQGKVNLSTLLLLDRADPNDPNMPVGPSQERQLGSDFSRLQLTTQVKHQILELIDDYRNYRGIILPNMIQYDPIFFINNYICKVHICSIM